MYKLKLKKIIAISADEKKNGNVGSILIFMLKSLLIEKIWILRSDHAVCVDFLVVILILSNY